jgi:hydroxyethylthiazole kinase-like sugar kinase family protein
MRITLFFLRKLLISGRKKIIQSAPLTALVIFHQGIEWLPVICRAGCLPGSATAEKKETYPGNFMLHSV